MDIKMPSLIISVAFIGGLNTACCQQPQSYPSTRTSNAGNCHTHAENAAKGTTKHCHAHTNGNNHRHTYGAARPQSPAANIPPVEKGRDYSYPSYYDRKKKGYYRGSVDEVIDPYARDVLRRYRN